MKKIFLVLAIATLVAVGAFAQSGPKNWISGEVSLFGAGVRYERMLNNKMSVGANAYWTTLIIWNELEAGGSFRYYIMPTFFVGGGLGFHIHTGTHEYAPGYDWFAAITGVAITPEVGWKIDVGKKGGFFIEPGVKIPVTFGMLESWGLYDGGFAVGFGVVPYFGLGGAF